MFILFADPEETLGYTLLIPHPTELMRSKVLSRVTTKYYSNSTPKPTKVIGTEYILLEESSVLTFHCLYLLPGTRK